MHFALVCMFFFFFFFFFHIQCEYSPQSDGSACRTGTAYTRKYFVASVRTSPQQTKANQVSRHRTLPRVFLSWLVSGVESLDISNFFCCFWALRLALFSAFSALSTFSLTALCRALLAHSIPYFALIVTAMAAKAVLGMVFQHSASNVTQNTVDKQGFDDARSHEDLSQLQ